MRFVYKLKSIYSSKLVIEYSLPSISLISSYIITKKCIDSFYILKTTIVNFLAKKIPHVVAKTEINTAINFSNLQVFDVAF